MVVHSNKTPIYKKHTPYWPIPGEHLTVEHRPFDPQTESPPGGLTVKNIYLSFDPYQRGQMRLPTEEGTYSIPSMEGQPAILTTLSRVLKSNHAALKPGDMVSALASAGEYATIPAELAMMARTVSPLPVGAGISLSVFVGPLGNEMTGGPGLFSISPVVS